MKLMLDCTPLSQGGGVQVALSFIENISNCNLRVFLVCTHDFYIKLKDKHLDAFFGIFICSKQNKLSLSRRLKQIEREVKPDLVFSVFGPSYWRPRCKSIQGFALGKMLYNDSRDLYESQFLKYKELLTDSVKKALVKYTSDYYIVESDVVKDRLSIKLGINPSKIYVVGNSYSPFFEEKVKHIGVECKFKPQSTYTIFAPASFYHHKNLEIIPRVAKELVDKYDLVVNFVFTLDWSSKGWERITDLAKKHGVESQIVSVGVVSNYDIARFYLECDAVICTSFVESSTAVIPEALITRKPLFVSDRDFFRYFCGDNAVYFDPSDVVDIARKIDLSFRDEVLMNRLKSNSLSQLKKRYPSPDEKWKIQLRIINEIMEKV